MPNESWKRLDENIKEFPKYYDRFPEELILNDTERKIFENLPEKEVQKIINMRRERRTSIYTRYFQIKDDWCESRIKIILSKKTKDSNKQRSNLRVLVIIGSELKIENIGKGDILLGNEDLSDALFIKQVFTSCYGLNENQILITSTQLQDFNNQEITISPVKIYFKRQNEEGKDKTIEGQKEKIPHLSISKDIKEKYKKYVAYYFKPIVSTQIGEDELHFTQYYRNIINPFNRDYLKSLNSDKNSELIIFFLDHRSTQTFSYIPYYHFIERISEIEFHHAIIFNEACNSGTLINLFKICKEFENMIHIKHSFPFLHKESSKDQKSKSKKIISKHF